MTNNTISFTLSELLDLTDRVIFARNNLTGTYAFITHEQLGATEWQAIGYLTDVLDLMGVEWDVNGPAITSNKTADCVQFCTDTETFRIPFNPACLDNLTARTLTEKEIDEYVYLAISAAENNIDDMYEAWKHGHDSQVWGIETLFGGDSLMRDQDYLALARALVIDEIPAYDSDYDAALDLDDDIISELIDKMLAPANEKIHKEYDFITLCVGRNEGYGDLEVQIVIDDDYLARVDDKSQGDDHANYDNVIALVTEDGDHFHPSCLEKLDRLVCDPVFEDESQDSFITCEAHMSRDMEKEPKDRHPENWVIDCSLTEDGYHWLFSTLYSFLKDAQVDMHASDLPELLESRFFFVLSWLIDGYNVETNRYGNYDDLIDAIIKAMDNATITSVHHNRLFDCYLDHSGGVQRDFTRWLINSYKQETAIYYASFYPSELDHLSLS